MSGEGILYLVKISEPYKDGRIRVKVGDETRKVLPKHGNITALAMLLDHIPKTERKLFTANSRLKGAKKALEEAEGVVAGLEEEKEIALNDISVLMEAIEEGPGGFYGALGQVIEDLPNE